MGDRPLGMLMRMIQSTEKQEDPVLVGSAFSCLGSWTLQAERVEQMSIPTFLSAFSLLIRSVLTVSSSCHSNSGHGGL